MATGLRRLCMRRQECQCNAQCPVPSAQCPDYVCVSKNAIAMPSAGAQCPVPSADAQCPVPMPSAQCPVPTPNADCQCPTSADCPLRMIREVARIIRLFAARCRLPMPSADCPLCMVSEDWHDSLSGWRQRLFASICKGCCVFCEICFPCQSLPSSSPQDAAHCSAYCNCDRSNSSAHLMLQRLQVSKCCD